MAPTFSSPACPASYGCVSNRHSVRVTASSPRDTTQLERRFALARARRRLTSTASRHNGPTIKYAVPLYYSGTSCSIVVPLFSGQGRKERGKKRYSRDTVVGCLSCRSSALGPSCPVLFSVSIFSNQSDVVFLPYWRLTTTGISIIPLPPALPNYLATGKGASNTRGCSIFLSSSRSVCRYSQSLPPHQHPVTNPTQARPPKLRWIRTYAKLYRTSSLWTALYRTDSLRMHSCILSGGTAIRRAKTRKNRPNTYRNR